MIKRSFDLFFAIIGIIFLSPLFIFISILIKLDSRGSVLYAGKRVGQHERLFSFYKFRTMKPESDKSAITVGDKDTRIAKIGYYLRKTKLDELPQLFNILKGELSFVGPRPDVPKYISYYKKSFADYYKFKPGITSYSSIHFSNESELYIGNKNPEKIYIEKTIPQKVELDTKYFQKNSINLDIKIILLTLAKVMKI